MIPTFNKKRGFTLLEIIVVVAIMGLILSLGLIVNFDSYRGYIFRSERSVLVSILSKARSRALNNMYQAPHGVCLDSASKNYIVFHGNVYSEGSETNESLESNPAVTITSNPPIFPCSTLGGVIFSQLSGTTSPIDITLTAENRTEVININYEGRINW